MNMTECEHQNIKSHGLLRRQKLVIDKDECYLDDLPSYMQIEECLDCGEIRKEIYEEQVTTTRNRDLLNKFNYKPAKTYYTDAGNLVERTLGGDWYWNGQKMSDSELQKRLTQTGDNLGRQDVSSKYKELCYEAKYKSLEIRNDKDESIEKLRDAL